MDISFYYVLIYFSSRMFFMRARAVFPRIELKKRAKGNRKTTRRLHRKNCCITKLRRPRWTEEKANVAASTTTAPRTALFFFK